MEEVPYIDGIDAKRAFGNFIRYMVETKSFNWQLQLGLWVVSDTLGNPTLPSMEGRWEEFAVETGVSEEDIEILKPIRRTKTSEERMEWVRVAVDLLIRDPRAHLVEFPFIPVQENETLLEGQARAIFGWRGDLSGDHRNGPGRLVSLIETTIGEIQGGPEELENGEDFLYECKISVKYDRWKKYFRKRMLFQTVCFF